MLRALFAAVAALTLCACASLPIGAASSPSESFDAAGAAPIEAPVSDWGARSVYVSAPTLNRRTFDAPIDRRPDRRPAYATAVDRRYRTHTRRRRSAIVRPARALCRLSLGQVQRRTGAISDP